MEVVKVDSNRLVTVLWNLIETSANAAIQEKSIFRIGLSGGSLIKFLAEGAVNANTEWSKWQLYFCDERFVDESDDESTFGQYKKLFLPNTKLNEDQFVKINRTLTLSECAKNYEQQILNNFGIAKPTMPEFDLLLLGMGPDGHTCSLFPDHSLLKEESLLIAPISDSPKPPPERVTMTLPLINNAKAIIFPISGKAKAELIKHILKDDLLYPAGLIKPTSGKLTWLLDKEAASLYDI